MATTRQAAPGVTLPPTWVVQNPVTPLAPGTAPQIYPASGPFVLQAGADFHIPSGQYYVTPGPYSQLQTKDPVSGLWRPLTSYSAGPKFVTSDGQNLRVLNYSGCAVGALVTNIGSGYTSVPTVTASAGGSTWVAILGGTVSTTVTVNSGGSGYNYPPLVLFDPPPAGGVQAAGYASLTTGAVSSITITDQGSGYLTAPKVYIYPDARDIATGGVTAATATATLSKTASSGNVTAIVCTNPGTPVTSVPTLTISGGGGSSAAATAIMCFGVTGFTVTTAGSTYGNAQPFAIVSTGGVVAGSAATNALNGYNGGSSLFTPRQANISGTTTSGGAIQTTGSVINDAGLFQAVPTGAVLPAGSAIPSSTIAQVALTVGGVNDYIYLQPY